MQGLQKVGYKIVRYEFNKEIAIPEDWTESKLSKVCDILDGQRIPIEESERRRRKGNIPYYGASGIIDYIDDFIFDERLLCLAEDGENLRSRVLPVAFIIEGKTWVNNHAHVLKPKENVVDIKYLEYFLNYKRYEKYLSFTAQPKLNQNEMKKIMMLLPPLIEQQKIAYVISKVDELIQKIDHIIKQTQVLKKGLMQELLTKGIDHNKFKKSSVGNIPEEWNVGKLKDYTLKIGSGVTPRGGSKVYDEKGIPLIRSQNVHFDGLRLDDVAYISESIHNEMKNSKLIEGDVLHNITGASLGRCTVVPFGFGEGNVNQHVCIIRPNNVLDFHYLSLFLSSNLGQNMIFRTNHGLSREALNYEQISSFEIPLPPLKEQKMIARIISSIRDREVCPL